MGVILHHVTSHGIASHPTLLGLSNRGILAKGKGGGWRGIGTLTRNRLYRAQDRELVAVETFQDRSLLTLSSSAPLAIPRYNPPSICCATTNSSQNATHITHFFWRFLPRQRSLAPYCSCYSTQYLKESAVGFHLRRYASLAPH